MMADMSDGGGSAAGNAGAIAKVGVIGAGVMGAAIAAHVANAGVPVVLLDLARDGEPGALARAAVERMLKADPAPFMSRAAAKLVAPGDLDADFGLLSDCDWIVEAAVERLDVKQGLYRRVEAVRKRGAAVSSNTSTLPLAALTQGLPERFAEDFLVTHFFNPPRYMRLLEIVAGPLTRTQTVARVARFCDVFLGKTVIFCKDRPGFVANRLGAFWLQAAVSLAIAEGLDVEEADALLSRPVGVPKTGVFGLLDLVGLDLTPHVAQSLAAALAPDDPFQRVAKPAPALEAMIARGLTGRKAEGGFYRLNRAGGGRVKEAIDLATLDYRTARKPAIEALDESRGDLRRLMSHDSREGRYVWRVMSGTLAYAAALVGDAADDPAAVDTAMRLGYGWRHGPFELIDRIGAGWLADRLAAEGRPVPDLLRTAAGRGFSRVENGARETLQADGAYAPARRGDGVLLLEDVKLRGAPLLRNSAAALWDVGDGVACFEFTSKMNALDPDTLELLMRAVHEVGRRHRALVIYNEGENFSVGANLGLALFAANIAIWPEIEMLVAQGQTAYRMLKYAPFPVVGAPSGMALGGGCEILLHCDAVQAHAETYMGLVEVGVGLIPGWGGCKEMLARWAAHGRLPKGPMPAVSTVFELVGTARVAKSAAEAKELLYLRPGDGITMNRDRLLADAKAKALALAPGYAPPPAPAFALPGPSGACALRLAAGAFRLAGKASAHDMTVLSALGRVLSGGDADALSPIGEDALLKLEREAFMSLVRDRATLERVEHMLETGKPLRN